MRYANVLKETIEALRNPCKDQDDIAILEALLKEVSGNEKDYDQKSLLQFFDRQLEDAKSRLDEKELESFFEKLSRMRGRVLTWQAEKLAEKRSGQLIDAKELIDNIMGKYLNPLLTKKMLSHDEVIFRDAITKALFMVEGAKVEMDLMDVGNEKSNETEEEEDMER